MNRAQKRNTARSRKGCTECRRRKIKCDERKPQCGQCHKANVQCSIIDSVFRPHPYTFSVNSGAADAAIERSARNDDSISQQEEGATSPKAQPGVPENAMFPATQAQYWVAGSSPVITHDSDHYTNNDAFGHAAWSHDGQRLLSPTNAGVDTQMLSPQCSPSSKSTSTPTAATDRHLDFAEDSFEANEIPVLLRHFAECSGLWMDLFSHKGYFSQQSLLLSRNSLLVKYAACANSSKQLGHMKQPHTTLSGINTRQIFRRLSSRSEAVDFLWYGAKYYGKAIQSMADELELEGGSTIALSPDEVPWATAALTGSTVLATSLESRLVAACIMCHYEELSASWRAWSRHLNAIYSLLRLGQAESMLQNETQSPMSPIAQPKTSLGASFWYFVQNDFEESFIMSKPTRLDPESILLWQNAGLPLLPNGNLVPFCFQVESYGNSQDLELLALHALLRLMCKVNNYIKRTTTVADSTQTSSDVTHGPNDVEWSVINRELEAWLGHIPPSFEPDIVSERTLEEMHGKSALAKESWFRNSTCAIATVYYHMAKMLLIIHSPYLAVAGKSHQPTDWLCVSREILNNLFKHASDLLAVMLGRPNDAVRAHMVQPLYVAGRCLTLESDQHTVIAMLRSIETDLGIATGYRVRALVEEWGTTPPQDTSQLDSELSDLSSSEQ